MTPLLPWNAALPQAQSTRPGGIDLAPRLQRLAKLLCHPIRRPHLSGFSDWLQDGRHSSQANRNEVEEGCWKGILPPGLVNFLKMCRQAVSGSVLGLGRACVGKKSALGSRAQRWRETPPPATV
jgi:hypothetical protein